MNNTDNVTQLHGRNFNGETVKGLISACTYAGVSIEQIGNDWKIQSKRSIPGFDMDRTYRTFDEAVLFLVGKLLNNDSYGQLITGVAV